MSLKKRVEKLEKNPQFNEPERDIWLVVVTGELSREDADAKVEAVKAEYRVTHPEDVKRKINTISVIDEHTKGMTEELLRGENPRLRRIP